MSSLRQNDHDLVYDGMRELEENLIGGENESRNMINDIASMIDINSESINETNKMAI